MSIKSLSVVEVLTRFGGLLLPLVLYLVIRATFGSASPFVFALGVLAILVVPGYLLMVALRLHDFRESWPGLAAMLGLILQALNVFALFSFETFVKYRYVNFSFYIAAVTGGEIAVLLLVSLMRKTPLDLSPNLKGLAQYPSSILAFIFILSLSLNLYFQSYNSSAVLPDGALYLDTARSIVTTGRFSSLVVNDGSPYPFLYQVGLLSHTGIAQVLSVFFALGNVTYQTAKFGLAIVGGLLVYLVYELARLGLSRRGALLASSIVMVHPLLRFYSTILYGPEILSALLTLLTILFAAHAIRGNRQSYWVLSGIALFLSLFVWGADTVALFIALALMIDSSILTSQGTIEQGLVESSSVLFSFTLIAVALRLSSHILMWLALVGGVLCFLVLLHRINALRYSVHLLEMFGFFLILTQLYFFRSYLNPQAYISGVQSSTELLRASFTIDLSSVTSQFVTVLWPNLNAFTIPVLVVTGLLSVIWINNRISPVYLFVLGWIISQLIFFSQLGFTLSESRFYISLTIAFAVISSNFVEGLALKLGHPASSVVGKHVGVQAFLEKLSHERAIPIAGLILVILILSSFPLYVSYNGYFYARSVEGNGWQPVLNWIKNNTLPSDIFLTSSSPRLWAWFADREFVGSSIILDNQPVSLDAINASNISQLIVQYNISYVLIDSTYQAAAFRLPQLADLYVRYPDGNVLPLTYSGVPIALRVVASSSSQTNDGLIVLYKVLRGAYRTVFEDNTFSNWTNARGLLTKADGNLTVVTLANETWGNYAYLYFKTPISVPSNSFVAVSVLSLSSSLVHGGLAVKLSDGSLVTQYFGSPGIYYVSLAGESGKTITELLLYSLLQNTTGQLWVSYGFIQIQWIVSI